MLTENERLSAVRKLTGELHALQDRLNDTIEQVCELLSGADVSAALKAKLEVPRAKAAGAMETSFSPDFLQLPSFSVATNNPASGHSVGADTKLFTDYKTGLVQLIQVPSTRGAEARYGLVLNYADFDGSFLSLVVDARVLLGGMPAGRARVGLAWEARAQPTSSLYAKCAWKSANQWTEHKLDCKLGRPSVESFELPAFDPAQVEALDFHFIFNPQSRGSVEIRRLMITLTVEPASAAAPAPESVFEAVTAR
jgi:hypothetical protein